MALGQHEENIGRRDLPRCITWRNFGYEIDDQICGTRSQALHARQQGFLDVDVNLGSRCAEPTPPFIHCEFSSDSLPSRGSISLTLTPGEGVPLGDYKASVTIQCLGDHAFPMTIPIKGVGYLQ